MKALTQRIYNLLPQRLRSASATLHGFALRRWRYGSETDRLVEEAIQREHWTTSQWRQWQGERLARVLHQAATHVPYYRALWQNRRAKGDYSTFERLQNWPILDKQALRRTPRAFLVDGVSPRKLFSVYTSGTTGTSLRLWQSRALLRSWYALFEARSRLWYGVSRHDNWAILGGQLVVPFSQTRPPFWVWNWAMRQLYLSAHHIAPPWIPEYLNALREYGVKYIIGYPSAINALARHALDRDVADLRLQVAIANAEPVFEYQRENIRQAFGCALRETYGMSEKAFGAGECEAGQMHTWPDVGVVEVIRDGQPVPPGEPGELVVTGLLETEMPLIRYRLGDTVALANEAPQCPCGRTLPLLGSVVGRLEDVFTTPDGREVYYLDNIFKSDLPLQEVQLIQDHPDRIRVHYVAPLPLTKRHADRIVSEVRARLGKVEVILQKVSAIPRGPNGKLRSYISRLPQPAERSRATREAAHG